MKKCPFCAEEILDEAIKCKHCGEILEKEDNPSQQVARAKMVADQQDTEAWVEVLGKIYLLTCVAGGLIWIILGLVGFSEAQTDWLAIGLRVSIGVGLIFTGAVVGFLMRLFAGISCTLRQIAGGEP